MTLFQLALNTNLKETGRLQTIVRETVGPEGWLG